MDRFECKVKGGMTMPMYFPDLDSVQKLAERMAKHQEDGKKYKGIIPQTEAELSQARTELADYMRSVWKDEVFAMEIELAVSEDNYKILNPRKILTLVLYMNWITTHIV